MLKTKKTFFILMIIFLLLGFNFSYCVELNMTDDSDLTVNSGNTSNTNTTNYGNDNENYGNTSYDDSDNYNTNSNYSSNVLDNSSDLPVTVSSVDSASDSGLQLSDILNIILIVIGVLLILLSIAILIRLKN